jgi:N-acetylmuramoyl-L-alanine amidase
MRSILILIYVAFIACNNQKIIIVATPVMADSVLSVIKPVLVIDAGHGAVDPGAVNDSLHLYEKDIARKIVDAVMRSIDTNKIRIIETRPGDSNIHRHERIKLANLYNPNMLLSVHVNYDKDTSYNGFELGISDSLVVKMNETDTISIDNPNKMKAIDIAKTLTTRIASQFPKMRNRYIKIRKDRIWMICAGKYPSVLLEFGFIKNRSDLAYLTDKKAIKKLAEAIKISVYHELLPENKPMIKGIN